MMPRIISTPLAMARPEIPALTPRSIDRDVLSAVLPGPGRERLAQGEVIVVTTGQQPGLFTGPLYTVHKALSAIALAQRLERDRRVAVVPVFWVAGDDHDFAEANHTWVLGRDGEAVKIVLRERAHEAAQLPLFREPCGPEMVGALEALAAAVPDSEYKPDVLRWLGESYRADTNLADAAAEALNTLLSARGLAVFRAYDRAAKRAAAPWILRGLDITLADGLTPVMIDARLGRDRVRPEGRDSVTRRSGEHFSRSDVERIANDAPERLSPNVLLRPVIEAALFPTVAYLGGPGEMEYLPESRPLFEALGVQAPASVPRWSGLIIEPRVDKVLERHGLSPADFGDGTGPAGQSLEARLVREGLPPEVEALLADVRSNVEQRYERLGQAVHQIDPTLQRTVQSARNAALAGTHDIEKKLVASLKRSQGTLLSQIARARAALAPGGKPQERVLTAASFLARYGPGLLDEIAAEVARWAGLP